MQIIFVSRGLRLRKGTKFQRFVASALSTLIPSKEIAGRDSQQNVCDDYHGLGSLEVGFSKVPKSFHTKKAVAKSSKL